MDSFDSDNVKEEKEDAVRRYNVERMLRNGLSFIGIFLVFLLLSCSSFPTLIPDTVRVVGNFCCIFISSFNNTLFTFAVVNIIVFAVYVLSSQKQPTGHDTDNYHEYVSSRRSLPIVVQDKEETPMEREIVLVENAVVKFSSSIVNTITDTKSSVSPIKPQRPKEYRRSRSMVSESQSRRVPREFRRSDTEPPRKSMDEMSSEEFQLIIDGFIAEKKKCLMLESTRRKENCTSIAVN
ncbi:hypothetical protein F3Y22_tig00110210pilonHSYRG00029 [Hibiscus syriacus]|uniref:CYP722 protein n=1 Tax=Hibiscus syriacus TaxID=106335 RepID=A0A6A3B8P5_HIBSY|nr:uncharacterized protein LOC120113564 [Hibiscus syriacus]KAE8713390.1 hypothetical protein F3Y22_tig00110210pilonHSYRG00029 [Hibiscus syriacus]